MSPPLNSGHLKESLSLANKRSYWAEFRWNPVWLLRSSLSGPTHAYPAVQSHNSSSRTLHFRNIKSAAPCALLVLLPHMHSLLFTWPVSIPALRLTSSGKNFLAPPAHITSRSSSLLSPIVCCTWSSPPLYTDLYFSLFPTGFLFCFVLFSVGSAWHTWSSFPDQRSTHVPCSRGPES